MAKTKKSDVKIELLRKNDIFEIGSVQDVDLMKIRCFGTHEGVNENGTDFPRDMLLECYPTFIDKPLILVQDSFGLPTGHGFNFQNGTFDNKIRLHVGHITNAFPCIVDDSGNIFDVTGQDSSEFPEGEFRIICDLVLYKYYLTEVSEIILDLHLNGMLNFSMEGLMDYFVDENNIKHCTNIQFTGLAIVKRPAFVNSHSLEVAEKKQGGTKLDFEKLYNDLKSEHDTLIADNARVVAELETKKAELASKEVEVTEKIEALANKEIEISEANSKIEELTPFKEQVETAEKTAAGQKRFDRLSKLGYTEKTVDELSAMDQATYSALLEDVLDKASQKRNKGKENASGEGSFIGIINHDTGFKSGKDRLSELMLEMCK